MIVPRYWAEGRLRHRDRKRQVTVRRFGWSDASQEEAQANADGRTRAAFDRLVSGEKLPRRDPKVPYNGADGVPIREEIVDRHGETIITRNSYGARCLNTPDVLFADMDSPALPPMIYFVAVDAVLLSSLVLWYWLGPLRRHVPVFIGIFGAIFVGSLLGVFLAGIVYNLGLRLRGGSERIARRRVRRFLAEHPEANLRLYRTPAGHRVLATHRTFDPGSPQVEECFRLLCVDRVYARMCGRQQCFRARVSPKPWRIGITDRFKPRRGTWPLAPERLPARTAWVEAYESAARSFAACVLVESFGSGAIDPTMRACMELHDELCGANSGRPIA